MDNFRSGYVAIVGNPNVGKSTLMNKLMGEKLSIATKKPQTTRKRILGIHSTDDHQIIFLDTPGILNPKYLLQEQLLNYIDHSISDADLLLFMLDVKADKYGDITFQNEAVKNIIARPSPNKILILNKMDLSNQESVAKLIQKFDDQKIFKEIIPISALTGFNTETVMRAIIENLPEGPKFYPEDQISDSNERFFVSEIVREKVFELFEDELPYSTEVVVEEFKERDSKKDFISAAVIVERDSQKAIVIGKKGAKIKRLGELSREEIESFLGREIYLELRVKVKRNWRSDKNMLKNFGYMRPED